MRKRSQSSQGTPQRQINGQGTSSACINWATRNSNVPLSDSQRSNSNAVSDAGERLRELRLSERSSGRAQFCAFPLLAAGADGHVDSRDAREPDARAILWRRTNLYPCRMDNLS